MCWSASINEQTGKLYTVIRVEDVRRTVAFFGSTAGEGGWRVAIVDTVDELAARGRQRPAQGAGGAAGARAASAGQPLPGRELPTIRSRCRRLLLRPLAEDESARRWQWLQGAKGTIRKSHRPLQPPTAAWRARWRFWKGRDWRCGEQIASALRELPNPDPRALHSLAEKLAGTDPQVLATFVDLANGWLSQCIRADAKADELARVAEAWERINAARARRGKLQSRSPPVCVFDVCGARRALKRKWPGDAGHFLPSCERRLFLRRLARGHARVLGEKVQRRFELPVIVRSDQVVLDRRCIGRAAFTRNCLLALTCGVLVLGAGLAAARIGRSRAFVERTRGS